MSLLLANTAAMAAHRHVTNTHHSIYTAIDIVTSKYKVSEKTVIEQLLKMYPQYTSVIAMSGKK